MIFRLLYRAKANYAPFTFHDLEIMRTAISFNTKHELTGFLLRADSEYFQILEGPQETVECLTERIRNDGRIYDFAIIWADHAEARLFGLWTMGFHMLGQNDDGLPHRLSRLSPQTQSIFKKRAILDVAQLAMDKYQRAAESSP